MPAAPRFEAAGVVEQVGEGAAGVTVGDDIAAHLPHQGGYGELAATPVWFPKPAEVLTYIELVSEAPASELYNLAASLGPDAEEAYMTTAEMLRTEGRTEGLAEGRTEGRTEGLAEALVQVLTIKFGTPPEDLPPKVRAASSAQVQEWTARAITAEKLDDVFG